MRGRIKTSQDIANKDFKWPISTSYVVESGHVRPVGPRLETDPWRDYAEQRRSARKAGAPPYQDLLDLAPSLAAIPRGDGYEFTEEAKRSIEGWCGKHGLLGLLPNRVSQITLAPHWRGGARPLVGSRGYTVGHVGGRVQRTYKREGARWLEFEHVVDGEVDVRDAPTDDAVSPPGAYIPEPEDGEVLSEEWGPRGWKPPAEALVARLGADEPDWVPLGEGVGKYFPHVPREEAAGYRYPEPMTDAFWAEYAEPLDDFARAVVFFADAVKRAGSADATERDAGLRMLRSLVQPVSVVIGSGKRPASRESVPGIVAGSLLGAYALMALWDIGGGARPLTCEACRKPFVSSQYQAKFCSATCRWSFQKRKERKRKSVRTRKAPRAPRRAYAKKGS